MTRRMIAALIMLLIACTAVAGLGIAEAAAPVLLSDLNIISENKNIRKSDVADAYGNEYAGPCFELVSYGKSSRKGEYITQSSTEFVTGGAYRYLTGTFFARADQPDDFTVEFMVYADDVLIYCSEPVTRRMKAVDFAIDIAGCDILKISSRSYDHTTTGTNPGIVLVNAAVCAEYEGELTAGIAIDPDKVPLTDLHVFGTHSAALTNTNAGPVEDAYGNVYKCVYAELVSYGSRSGEEYDTQAYTEYVAGGKYRYLSGSIFVRPDQDDSYEIEFLVYADDELVYSSGMIDRRAGKVDFVAEIGECDIVRIMSRSLDRTDTGTNPGIILVNSAVSVNDPRGTADAQ